MQDIILASSSKRRYELLKSMGVPFRKEIPHVEEVKLSSPKETVIQNALIKAEAVQKSCSGSIILSADTVVSIDGNVIGKPKDADDAVNMLKSLCGRWHTVYTGVCLISETGESFTELCGTRVHMVKLSEEEIKKYVSTGEPMDKAGGYALQGIAGAFISEIHGSYSNVIGLPTSVVRDMLKNINYY